MLARLHRAGELTPVYVPLADDEAMRDLTRAREDAKSDQKKCKQRLMAILLRNGHRYSGRTHWSQVHMRWLADIKMPHRAQQIVLQEYIDALTECRLRVERLTEQIRQLLPDWRMLPVVTALQSLRGVSLIVAVTTVAEIGDLSRFTHPAELMGYLGLVPSEHSSGRKDQARSDHQANKYCKAAQGAQPRSGEPSSALLDKALGRTHVFRKRQLRDEAKSCGNQPANIRVINRRNIGSAPLGALQSYPQQGPL